MNTVSPEQEVFAAALACSTSAARDACLLALCGADAALRQRVEALLLAAEAAGDFLEAPPPGFSGDAGSRLTADEFTERPGDRIGRYKLLEKIGEGGCGVVYMAEQEEPVRRRVALKVIKPGMDTRAVVARFEAERQALAMMDHAHIAKVIDGGATPAGRPYFVMELVRGVPVTAYCDEARLPTRARLRLFVQICQAIQHAHQKGIIHRDLKPSNILVTVNDGTPVPRVIDFGIAKATGQRLTDKTLFTQFHAFIGTPAYTSPEQAEMSSVDIDTRSDIYSLGVLLYELLTGRTPFDGEHLLSAGLDEMRRIIRDEEPLRPSNRLHTLGIEEVTALSGKRKATVPELAGDVRGDLDWIVMKCLEKDRSRRYETANGLAADVQRHLDNEPILARPPGRVYRFRKLVSRNQATFAAIMAVALALVTGTAVSMSQAMRAQRGEARANAALADLRASAPAYAAEARGLAAKGEFAAAIDKLDYAINLRPDSVDYLLTKAGLLECQFQFAEAATVFRAALQLNPAESRARANHDLCETLGAAEDAFAPQWHDTLAALYVLMTREQRSEAELAAISRLVMKNSRERLKTMEPATGHSFEEGLTFAPHGLLSLDLEGAPVTDLGPLRGLPLSMLDAAGSAAADLHPLKQSPLVALNIAGTAVTTLEALRGMQTLQNLSLDDTSITDLSPLQGLPVTWLALNGTRAANLAPLTGMPLKVLRIGGTPVTNLMPLSRMPLQELDATSIPATDFSPLAECEELTEVYLSNTALNRLDAFRGRRLEILRFDRTAVTDLSSLAGMPLHTVRFDETPVTDVAPLLQCRGLQNIGLPRGVRNAGVLRGLPDLRRISFRRDRNGDPAQSASEFWAEWDEQHKAAK